MRLANDITDRFLDSEFQFNEFVENKARQEALKDMAQEGINTDAIEWNWDGVVFAIESDYFTDENDTI